MELLTPKWLIYTTLPHFTQKPPNQKKQRAFHAAQWKTDSPLLWHLTMHGVQPNQERTFATSFHRILWRLIGSGQCCKSKMESKMNKSKQPQSTTKCVCFCPKKVKFFPQKLLDGHSTSPVTRMLGMASPPPHSMTTTAACRSWSSESHLGDSNFANLVLDWDVQTSGIEEVNNMYRVSHFAWCWCREFKISLDGPFRRLLNALPLSIEAKETFTESFPAAESKLQAVSAREHCSFCHGKTKPHRSTVNLFGSLGIKNVRPVECSSVRLGCQAEHHWVWPVDHICNTKSSSAPSSRRSESARPETAQGQLSVEIGVHHPKKDMKQVYQSLVQQWRKVFKIKKVMRNKQ